MNQQISPQIAAGIVATEHAWRDLEAEFGFANDRHKAHKILGVLRGNAYRYPGFQFTESGTIYESVLEILRIAPGYGVSDEDIAQWFLLTSLSLDGKRPVDVIVDTDRVVAIFRSRFGVQW